MLQQCQIFGYLIFWTSTSKCTGTTSTFGQAKKEKKKDKTDHNTDKISMNNL